MRDDDSKLTMNAYGRLGRAVLGAALAALAFTVLLVVRSVIHFTTTGPTIREEIAENFFGYAIFAVARLGLWAFVISFVLALAGLVVYAAIAARRRSPGFIEGFIAGGIGLTIGFAFQFSYVLMHEPSTLLASWAYAPGRLVRLWPHVYYPEAYAIVRIALLSVVTLAIARLVWWRLNAGALRPALVTTLLSLTVGGVVAFALSDPEPVSKRAGSAYAAGDGSRPNIVLIGNDTMRADRLGVSGMYDRDLTPFIDSLAARGTNFAQAYVPQGRTAPSMTSLLTGAWTDTHTVTSNFVRDEQTRLSIPTLPRMLAAHGYHTVAIGDWAASDIGKIDFGFDELVVSPDQWNFKYLLRQGPRDLRLFVSLFTGNRFGRIAIPEIYYLAGRPLTSAKAREARRQLTRLAGERQPFMMMLFVATSHGPFGSEYPYYTMFSGTDYAGDSKFAMTRVSSPEEIAERQSQGREAFDVQQLIDLYDGTVRHFDDEVRRTVEHIESLGIADNTIIVVFSDHGTDFFERGTWGQGNVVGLVDYSGQIPLVVLDPRSANGNNVDNMVRIVDVAPTLLDLAGLPSQNAFEGVSLRPYIEGRDIDLRLASYSETGEHISRIKGLRENQRRAPPLLELLEIPDRRTGTIGISVEGQRAIDEARQRAIRTDRWFALMLPLEQGARYFLFDAESTTESPNDVSVEHPQAMRCFMPAFEDPLPLAQRLESLSSCLAATESADALIGDTQ